MLNNKILAIIKREINDKLFTKSFIIITILMPALMLAGIALPTFLSSFKSDDNVNLILASNNDVLIDSLESEFKKQYFVTEGAYKIQTLKISKQKLNSVLDSLKIYMLKDEVTGVLFLSNDTLQNKKADYYAKNPNNMVVFEKLNPVINKVLIDLYFKDKNISDADVKFARERVDFSGFRVTEKDGFEEEGYGNIILSFVFTFLLYISLLMIGNMIMQSVVEEKTSRIVEVLLSSVSADDLMKGKIIGTAITGLIQMFIWFSPIFLALSNSLPMMPKEFLFSISETQLLFFFLNFLIGLTTFLGLFAMFGSLFDNPQEAQSGIYPLMMLIIIPFFIALSLQQNPENPVAFVSCFIPFASLIVLPARMALLDMPLWQILTAISINLGTLILIFPIAGKIYRVGVLWTGKKPKWSEIISWLKLKY